MQGQLPNAVEAGAQSRLDNLLGSLVQDIGDFASDDPESKARFCQYVLKVAPCPRRGIHEWSSCAYSHPGEKAARRDPLKFNYAAIACAAMKQKGMCARGDSCPYAHSAWEYWLHPQRYHTALCSKGENCTRQFCFFAHSKSELRVSTVRQRVLSASALPAAASDRSLPKESPTSSSATQVPLLLQNQGQEPQQAQQQAQQGQQPQQQQQQQQQLPRAQPQRAQQLKQQQLLQLQQVGEPSSAKASSGPDLLGWQLASSSGMQSARLGLGAGLAASSIWGGDLTLGLCGMEPALQGAGAGTTATSSSVIPSATSNPAGPTALQLTQDGTTQAMLQVLIGELARGGIDAAQAAAVLSRLQMQLLPPLQPQIQLSQAVLPDPQPGAFGLVGGSQSNSSSSSSSSSAGHLPWSGTSVGSGTVFGGWAVRPSWGQSNA